MRELGRSLRDQALKYLKRSIVGTIPTKKVELMAQVPFPPLTPPFQGEMGLR